MTTAEKIKAALTEQEYQLFQTAAQKSIEMFRLLNDRVNEDVREQFSVLAGKENVPPEWKPLDLEDWTDRANEVLGPEAED